MERIAARRARPAPRARHRAPEPPQNDLAGLIEFIALLYAIMFVMSLPFILVGVPQIPALTAGALCIVLCVLLWVDR